MSGRPRIVVTGAGGFIGGRVVEAILQNPSLGDVVPLVRRWSTVARIGRYPVEAVQADLLDAGRLREAVRGADVVVHCAVGNRRATVEGTRNLLEVARAAGVRRFVHISTIDVYGRAEGVVDEDHPHARTGREYGDSKIEAEELCMAAATRDFEVVILRPTIVYGPFSDLWTLEFAQRLRDGAWTLPREACQGTCNLVYVDDLVRCILRAVEAPGVSGRAYNVNGPDRVTWQEYVEALNRALEYPELSPPPAASSRVRSTVVQPLRRLIKAIFVRFQGPVLALYKRSRWARRLMKGVQGSLQRVPSPAEYDLYGRVVEFPTRRAELELGYVPQVGMAEGVARSAAWLRHEGDFTPPSVPA